MEVYNKKARPYLKIFEELAESGWKDCAQGGSIFLQESGEKHYYARYAFSVAHFTGYFVIKRKVA